MREVPKNCPDCGAELTHRLGIFECPACKCQVELHSESRAAAHPPAPAAESNLYARLNREVQPTEEPDPPGMQRLHREKLVCFWGTTGLTIISLLGIIWGMLIGSIHPSRLLSDVFWEVFYIFALYELLFVKHSKYRGVYAAMLALDLLAIAVAVVFIVPFLKKMAGSAGVLPACLGLPLWLSLIGSAAWTTWVLWILYREEQLRHPG